MAWKYRPTVKSAENGAGFENRIGCRYNRGVGMTKNRENADALEGK